MACLGCGASSEVGALCAACGAAVTPCEGLIPEHLRSTVGPEDAAAWVVDGFGNPHALAERSLIGRSHEAQLVVLAASVSREHAELRHASGDWHLRDLGSRNGSFVDGARCQGRAVLRERAVIRLGDVALWFLPEVVAEPTTPPSMETGSIAGGLVRFVLEREADELCILGSRDPTAGGALLHRPRGSERWSEERALPPLEFQLLRALCARASEEARSPAVVRGCVATKQLAKDLPFHTRYANEENVRQVVRRLRTALAELRADDLLAVAPGRGYYLACPVAVGR